MAKELRTVSIVAPGFYGLNTQESAVTLAPGYALVAQNCVIDKYGRLGARKGRTLLTDAAFASSNFQGGHEHIDVTAATTNIAWTNTTFYKGATAATPTAITDNSTAFTSASFSAATLNDKAFFVQEGDEPRYYDSAGDTLEDISTAGNTVTNLAAITGAQIALSAYGRLWLANTDADKMTVYWSNLLDGTNFDSGTAGSLDLASVLVNGSDEITGLAGHNGRLIIFTRNNVIVYGDTDADQILDPANMRLVEVINGVGCTSHFTIHNAGADLVFLSDAGLRSLGRVLQEKSQPMRDLSMNIRDDLLRDIRAAADPADIKAVYSQNLAAYMLLFPSIDRVYYFDMRNVLQDGSNRVTIWNKQTQVNLTTYADNLYYFGTDGVYMYDGYTDEGSSYQLKYYTTYFDMEDSTKLKHVKRLSATVIGGTQQDVVFKLTTGYSGASNRYTVSTSPAISAEFNIAEYDTVWEYTTGEVAETLRVPAGGTGTEIQVGFEVEINGKAFSLQKLSLYLKEGRVI